MSSRKDVAKLLKQLRRTGYTVELTNGGHFKVTPPFGRPVYMSQTPSCPFAIHNIRADIRRAQRDAQCAQPCS